MIAPRDDSNGETTGAVLVIGGGIAGIQASLDLAESGQKVYLLERSPAIGGNMARLDKTFPTNDCAMCILSPKIVECGRHRNIETITWADLEEVRGAAGHFNVKVRRRARFVDLAKCTGCGDCAEVCPIQVENEFEAAIGMRKGIFRPCPQAYPNVFVIDKRGKSPCRVGCPAGININAYVALTAAGRFDEALDSILETVPLPGVLGRVCDHPCETQCHLKSSGDPVSICALKRFLADRRKAEGKPSIQPGEQNLEKVAIIGGGPAGLSAGRELARQGYRPVIFEATSKAGGMLAWGIPDYRLPPDILEDEIQDILSEGVELRLSSRLGQDITWEQLKQDGYKALVLAVGAQSGSTLRIEGESLGGVTDAIAFLHGVNEGGCVSVGRHVTVVGGGNSAVDSARTARRLGAESVTIVYRRSRTEMPAIAEEIEAAEAEGIAIHFLASPSRLVGQDGRVSSMECIRMELGEPDESGRFRPEPIVGSEFLIETDMVIAAVGQKVVWPDDSSLHGIDRTRWGTVAVDELDGSTGLPGVFSVGDAATGPRSVIEALAEGRKAAAAVHSHLRGTPFEPPERVTADQVVEDLPEPDGAHEDVPRQHGPAAPMQQRVSSFVEVEGTLSEQQAVAEAGRCLHCALCSECMACVKACKADAILHDQQDEIEALDVGAIVVVPGFEEFLASQEDDFGYSRYPDVVSSIQFERILSASGPFGGHVQRPSDGKQPRKIAFLQCVGSRDISCRNAYCSSVCCMYAIKEAVIAKEHLKDVDVTIFFMDIRAFGKDFDRYYERAKLEYGVKFVRARVSDVYQNDGSGKLKVQFSPESGGVERDEFDMVVLSVGLEPASQMGVLARKLGVRLLPSGFVWTDPSNPLHTSRPGVFVGGAACGPKDIPETVVQASAAACEAGRLLTTASGSLTTDRVYPPERNVAMDAPRIGVFVCHCGTNIGGTVSVSDVTEYAKTLPHVVYSEDNLYTCSQDSQEHLREVIEEQDLNRVVVASCSPRTHEALFQETLREAGLNANLFTMTNIRDQCSWAHMNEPAAATVKSSDLIRMAVAKAALAEPLQAATIPLVRKALVVGGGLAGMTAALAIADHGYDVSLVERETALGGNLRDLPTGFEDQDVQALLARKVQETEAHPRITIHAETTLEDVTGFVGNYATRLSDGSEFEHGVVVLATGANEYTPTEHAYGDARVVTQRQLSGLLDACTTPWKTPPERVVMIQCVGSRSDEHPYCSRVCCTRAVKNAVRIRQLSPGTEVLILYRDIRTYGMRESYYQQARDLGVLFVRFDHGEEPCVTAGDRLAVRLRDPLLGAEMAVSADMVVLSTGIVADDEANDRLGKLLKVPVNADGFFMEAHAKLRPVEFATEGVFLAGLAHGPKSLDESMSQALAAASRACTVLQKTEIEAQATIAAVRPEKCVSCGLCEAVCAYGAVTLELQHLGKEERVFAKVNPALCKGCGACAAGCRSGAIALSGFTDQQILAEILQL